MRFRFTKITDNVRVNNSKKAEIPTARGNAVSSAVNWEAKSPSASSVTQELNSVL